MRNCFVFITLLLVIVTCANALGGRTGVSSNFSKYQSYSPYFNVSGGKKYQSLINQQKQTENQKVLKSQKGFGISAWGLVFLVVSIIMSGVGVYYAVVFYPLLCKKERKYDRIELSTV